MEEASHLRRFKSKYIVRYFDSFFRMVDGENTFVLITEHCNLGDLSKILPTHAGKKENLKLYLRITKCILKGLKVMHSKKKFHRDLKPLNIFVSGDLNRFSSVIAKLGDFGLVKDIDHSMITDMSFKGTLNYFSPEMMTAQ